MGECESSKTKAAMKFLGVYRPSRAVFEGESQRPRRCASVRKDEANKNKDGVRVDAKEKEAIWLRSRNCSGFVANEHPSRVCTTYMLVMVS